MACPFCRLLYKEYLGEYIRVGVVCGCDTNDHIYRDGFIQKRSFYDNTIRLYDSPKGGDVIFTACCDEIFELYIFPRESDKTTDIPTMIEERYNLLKSVQKDLKKEGAEDE